MTTAYTSLLGLALPVTGELSGTWGDTVNNSITSLLDSAIAGTQTLTADTTLTTTTGAANQSRQAILLCSPASANITITAPAQSKIYTVINTSATYTVTVRGVGPTTGVTIATSESAVIAWNGTDFIRISSNSTFTAPVVIEGTTTSAALRITQLGTGNALLVEDSTNPDSTPFVIDANGRVIQGYTSNINNYASQISDSNPVAWMRWSANTGGPSNIFAKSRGVLPADYSIVQSGDTLGTLLWAGSDGSAFIQAASITAAVDGTPGTNDMPGRLVFSTTADGASSPTTRLTIYSDGSIQAGTSQTSSYNLRVGRNISGATSGGNFYASGTVQSDVTSNGYGFLSEIKTAAASFVLNSAHGFRASQGTIGAGSSITNQYGFNADSTLTGATNNYGFFSQIASGTGRYNFYAAGTAENYFGGNTTISVTDNTNAALRITQLGTGNALLVEDSSNPDSTPFVIDASGNVVVGATTAPAIGGASIRPFSVVQTNSNAFIGIGRYTADTGGAGIIIQKSRGTTVGDVTTVQNNDVLGTLFFAGADGTSSTFAALISSSVDGTPGTNDMPGRLVFSTTADGASSPTERMRINNAGNLSIGGTGSGAVSFYNQKNITGSTIAYANYTVNTVQSDVTSGAYGYRTGIGTAAASFSLTAIHHYRATQATFGAGSSVSSQYGFIADDSLIGATNNYGFYSNIASGTGRYNFYAAGTAENFFGGNTVVSVTDNTNAALRITQLGTGNALLVEDSSNPDATPFVIDSFGNVLAGLTTARSTFNGGTVTPGVQVEQISGGRLSVTRNSANATAPDFIFGKTRGATIGAVDAVVSGDILGLMSFAGADGTNLINGAQISAQVDGTPGTNDMPGRLVFSTTADGASTPTERMRINSSGNVGIGDGVTQSDSSFTVNKSFTGATTTYGIRSFGTIQSGVTNAAVNFDSGPSTAASAFTLGSLVHYQAKQGTFGLGSAVTSQIGFLAVNSLTGATNNYGFYGDIASGTGRWNLYMNGTADNYLAGDVGIGTTTPVTKLEIAGTNNTTWSVTASITGTTMDVTAVTTSGVAVGDLVHGSGVQPYTRVTALGTGTGGIGTYTVSVSQTLASGTVVGCPTYGSTLIRITETDTAVTTGQPTGGLQFYTSDNSTPTAGVGAYVAGVAESNAPDTSLVFGTRDGSGGGIDANERMRIDSSGNVGIGTSSPTRLLTLSGSGVNTRIQINNTVSGKNVGLYAADDGSSVINYGSVAALVFSESGTDRMRIDTSGNMQMQAGAVMPYAPTPASISTTATLTNANIQAQIINTTGTSYTVTMPLGTTLETLATWATTNVAYDFFVINTASGTITMAVNTGVTSLGTLTIATGVSAQFRIRRTAANTFVLYRLG